jgi:hypothetical protein
MMIVVVPELEVGLFTEKLKNVNDLNASVYEVKDGIVTLLNVRSTLFLSSDIRAIFVARLLVVMCMACQRL